MSPRRGVVATRRTALGGALGATLALAACEAGEPDPAAPAETSPTTDPPDDPDQAMVDEVIAELDELITFTAAAAAARPRIGPWPAAFEALHRAHRAVLTDDAADETAPPQLTGSASEVGRQVTRREREAQQQLAEWAVSAQSGPLARLLASMSAAIAQQLGSPVRAVG